MGEFTFWEEIMAGGQEEKENSPALSICRHSVEPLIRLGGAQEVSEEYGSHPCLGRCPPAAIWY